MGLPPCLQALHPGIPDETSATRSIIRSFHVTMISRERLRQLRYHYDVLGNVGLMFDSLLRSNAPNQPRDNFSILPFPTSTKSRDLKKREDKNFQAELTRGTVVATDPRPEPSSRTDYNYVEQLRLRLLGFRKPSAYASCSIFFCVFFLQSSVGRNGVPSRLLSRSAVFLSHFTRRRFRATVVTAFARFRAMIRVESPPGGGGA